MDNIFNDFLKKFGEKVKEEREAKNLTLEDMEFHTGIDDSDFSKIESGKTNITFKTFLKVARGLNVHPEKLVDFEIDLKNEKQEI